jgi:predicted dehydrogenase
VSAGQPVRWAILGTSNIAAKAFLPALAEAQGGVPVVVASRDPEQARAWASANGVAAGVAGYAAALDDASVDAVYVALPNSEHATWAAAALDAGKVVLCEKPLCLTADQTRGLLAHAGGDRLLWEAYVFPFHPQSALLRRLLGEGAIGDPREIQSCFHFTVSRPENIRLNRALGGGALYDVGGYPVRLARLLLGSEPDGGVATAYNGSSGVDVETWSWIDFPGERRLSLSVGFRRPYDSFTRVLAAEGELRISNPFHPGPHDTVEHWRAGRLEQRLPAGSGTAFSHAIRHVHAVMRGDEEPRHLARDDALGNAVIIDRLLASIGAVASLGRAGVVSAGSSGPPR